MTRFTILTLFPEMIIGGLMQSVIKRAADSGVVSVECVNIRDFCTDAHKTADDYPYGGGAGMVMKPQPIYDAYQHAIRNSSGKPRLLYMTPQGKPFDQRCAEDLSNNNDIIILCGRYEGVDERVIEELSPEEISLGDFVLTGGEIAAMAVVDAVTRLLPGALGNESSAVGESFSRNGQDRSVLEYPQYTRPPVFRGRAVPEVLLSGHHGNVEKWRREQSLLRTRQKRPDLL